MIVPENEQGVVFLFAQEILSSHFDLVSIGTEYPDAIIKSPAREYRVEFEYRASNFIKHGHDPMNCDLVVCWIDDSPDSFFPVICLRDDGDAWYFKEYEDLPPINREKMYWEFRARRAEEELGRVRTQLNMMAGADGEEYECDGCGRMFATVQALNAHKRFCAGNSDGTNNIG